MRAIVAFSLRDLVRGRWALVAIGAFALTALAVSILGLSSYRQVGLRSVGPAAVSFVNVALLLPSLQALLLGALTVSANRERGLLGMLRASGASSFSLCTGTWAAVTLSTAISLGLGFGTTALVFAGNVPAEDLAIFGVLALVMLLAAASASAVGVLLGSLAGTRLQAALAAVATWFVLAVGLDLLVIGLGVFLRAGEPALLAAAVANPLQAARLAALLLLDAGATMLGPLGSYLVGRLGAAGSIGLLGVVLAAWTVVPLGLGIRTLRGRDL